MPVPKIDKSDTSKKNKLDLSNLDVSSIDSRLFVLMASSLFIVAARKSGFVYMPSLRRTQTKAILSNLPSVLARFSELKLPILQEIAKAVRTDADVYLKNAVRELAKLFAEE